MTKIYISSTYSDLVEHRQQVYDILRKMRYDVVAMEDYVATDERPLDKCLADVASCDLYVGIFAWRYGYIPDQDNPEQRSITELEYRKAGESRLERLIFLLDEDAPWPRSKMEKGAGGEKIETLRSELMAAHLLQFFKSPEELAEQVGDSVSEWAQAQLDARMGLLRARRDQADRERREMHERQRVVNLRPLDVTHFKNRLREMRALCDYLSDSSVRLVSVVGRGGMGKTALVSRVLADLERGKLPVPGEERELRIDGILYLSSRSTGLGLERIYTDVGRMLGEPTASRLAARWADRDASLPARVEYLLETMRDGLYLILLDMLEDYLTEDGEIAEEGLRLFVERCLTQPDGVRLIATSREEIKLAGSALRNARRIPLHEGLPDDHAVALLRELDPQETLGLCDAPEDDLRRAARLTRGIPRALEILAGILHEDPIASLPKLLADEGTFGVEVVEQLVTEGYRRLGDGQRRVMEALAVFDRPVDETAIAYLLHPWLPGLDARACLRRLVSSYFASANRPTGEYSLHPLDREYADRQIPEEIVGEEYSRRNLQLRAADFYASIRKPESEWKTIDDLAPQLAEFDHRIRAGDYDGACRLLNHLDPNYLHLWGHYSRLVGMREKLLEGLSANNLQVHNLRRLGKAYRALGQIERSVSLYEEALALAREIGDNTEESQILMNLGSVYRILRQLEQAMKCLQEALGIMQTTGNHQQEGMCLAQLGLVYATMGQGEKAIELYGQAQSLACKLDDKRLEGTCLSYLGNAYDALGQYDQAVGYHKKALVLAREIGHRGGEGMYLSNLGRAYRALGQIERAKDTYEEALAIGRQISSRRGESIRLSNLAFTYRALGEIEKTIELYEEALAIAREIGDRQREGTRLGNLGTCCLSLGNPEQAIKLYTEALTIARELNDRRGESRRLLGLGTALLKLGDISEAQLHFERVLSMGRRKSSHQAAFGVGVSLLYQDNPAARGFFVEAISHSRTLLQESASWYEVRYTLAGALVGQAACDPRWAEEAERAELLAPALAQYQRALENCAALGVVRDALRDLELIRAAAVDGLEPAFELLESHVSEPKDHEE